METTFGVREEVSDGVYRWSDQHKWNVFKQLAKEDKWSGKRLEIQIKYFLKTYEYKDWKPAHIFQMKASSLYPYAWAVQQYKEGNGRYLEAFKVPGVRGLMYRIGDGRSLPFEQVPLQQDLTPVQQTVEQSPTPPKEIRDFLAKGFNMETREQRVVRLEDVMQEVKAKEETEIKAKKAA